MAVTLTTTGTIVFGGAVFSAYMVSDLFGTAGMQFYGVRPTESVNVPVTQQGDAKFLDDGADHANEDSSMIAVNIPLFNPLKSSNLVKKSQVDTRPDLQLLMNLGKQHGRNVGNQKTRALLQIISSDADNAGNSVSKDLDNVTEATVQTETRVGIEEIAAAFDEAGIPADGRRGMLKSTSWYKLLGSDGVISKDFGGQANRQTAGGNLGVINYLNFDIMNCGVGFAEDFTDSSAAHTAIKYPTEFDMTNVFGVFWHEDAWALRHQTELENSAEWSAEKQVWLVLARLHMGAKTIMTDSGQSSRDGIHVLKNA